jgi:peptide methionine sulfoxide reductase msrA/msrB
MNFNKLNKKEKEIIINKKTEAPFSGEYENFSEEGVYACKRCGAVLYRSSDKFNARCGWPSFDDTVLGAIERKPDADGQRTEILCVRCGAHLGHVFTGEKLTSKNTRYCVNSISMQFIPQNKLRGVSEYAYFGGGCFWCIEASFKIIKGVYSVIPGYAGGKKENPNYKEVFSGSTGHAETVMIEYDPNIISYEALLEIFFAIHNPTTLNRQGNDIGSQYRSIILYKNDLQKEIVEKFIKILEKEKILYNPIITEVKPLIKFYEAENYHYNYFNKNPAAAYCRTVINPKISKLRKHLKKYLKQ